MNETRTYIRIDLLSDRAAPEVKHKMEDRLLSLAQASGDGSKMKILSASNRGLSDLAKRRGAAI